MTPDEPVSVAHNLEPPISEPVESGVFSGMPWWVRAISMIGAPAAIAIYLTWFLTSGVSRDVAQMREKMDAHVHELERHATDTVNGLHESREYLRLICQNTAKVDVDRAACNQVR